MVTLHGVKVVVIGFDDFRGHDPAHEEDGAWRRKSGMESQFRTYVHEGVVNVNVRVWRHTHLSVYF